MKKVIEIIQIYIIFLIISGTTIFSIPLAHSFIFWDWDFFTIANVLLWSRVAIITSIIFTIWLLIDDAKKANK